MYTTLIRFGLPDPCDPNDGKATDDNSLFLFARGALSVALPVTWIELFNGVVHMLEDCVAATRVL